MKKSLSIVLLGFCTVMSFVGSAHAASAPALSPQVKKSIDMHAVAFTGHHCSAHYTSKPSRPLPANRFGFVTSLMDTTFKQVKTEHPEITFRSDSNGKDLYRVQVGTANNMAFVVGYLSQGQFYTYGCQLN